MKTIGNWLIVQILALVHIAIPEMPGTGVLTAIPKFAADVLNAFRYHTAISIEIATGDALNLANELKLLPIPPSHIQDLQNVLDELLQDFQTTTTTTTTKVK